jgi:hypothetical protein
MTSRLKVASLVGLGLATVIAAFYVGKARAAGIPDADALTYTGYLEEGAGAPLSGTFAIDVTFYGSADGDDLLCTGGVDDFELRSGRFQVPLPDCVAAIKANPNIWVDVQVDGASLSRTKLGAVPFAVEAGERSARRSARRHRSCRSRKLALPSVEVERLHGSNRHPSKGTFQHRDL